MPSLRGLEHHFRPMAEAFVRQAIRTWPGLRVTSARRSHLEQLRLYQAAQRGENDGLPVARPGTSDHEVGLAFDLARPGTDPFSDPALVALGAEWLNQGGRWSARDPVHFAAPHYISDFHPRGLGALRRRRRA